ncbi:MAG: FeoB-associated Cys-rich membrane protein [Clostridia bacterium]|nr:FeoB-associated Cys-rich membrane protein [Clostridia bacterium]
MGTAVILGLLALWAALALRSIKKRRSAGGCGCRCGQCGGCGVGRSACQPRRPGR